MTSTAGNATSDSAVLGKQSRRSTALRVALGAAVAGTAGYLLYNAALGRRRRFREAPGSTVGATVSACSQITVQRSAAEVYEFLRDLDNLPLFCRSLTTAESVGPATWRVTAQTPWAQQLQWDVEESVATPHERLAWRSLEPSTLPSAAEVRLLEGRWGTELYVDAWFVPPASMLLAPALRRAERSRPLRRAGLTPSKLLQQELGRLRQRLESGETATVEGQSSGRGL